MPLIYKILLPDTTTECNCELVFPTLSDIKLLLREQEQLLDMLLLKKIDIKEEFVDKNSKKYATAVSNALIQVPT